MLKKRIILASFFMLCLGMPAQATSLETIIQQLKDQGYSHIEVERTWLGRIRVEAENANHEREIILNRTTFEILRDYAEPHDENEWHDGGLIEHD